MARLYISGSVTGIEDDNLSAFEIAQKELEAAGTSYPVPYYDGVALLPGWEQSDGAKLKKAVAEACGIPVKTVDEWLEEAR